MNECNENKHGEDVEKNERVREKKKINNERSISKESNREKWSIHRHTVCTSAWYATQKGVINDDRLLLRRKSSLSFYLY